MRLSVGLATAALAASASAAGPSAKDAKKNVVEGAYIVQFHDDAQANSLVDPVDQFYTDLSSKGIGAEVRKTFQPNIFFGTSFNLKSNDETDLDVIANLTTVKAVTPVRLFDRAAPVKHSKVKAELQKRAIGLATDNFTTHVMTGVDKLHKEGLDGKGIVIAEIDTGIDYTLPALGGGFGPGFKVAFGYDLVGDDYTGSETPVPDPDPIDCGGHGTHVAGIIAASNDDYVLGVAPAVTLGAYKVFGCTGQVSNEVLIEAFTMAYNSGADIITASIGGASGWENEPWSAATANIVALGTPCMLAAGNDGSVGLYYASAASAGRDITSVGAVNNINSPAVVTIADYIVDGSATSFGYTPSYGSLDNVELPLWTSTTDPTIVDDGCNGFTADLTGKIALIRRGTCTFVTKAQSAFNAGAKYIIIYNNVPGTLSPALDGSPISGGGLVTADLGASWVNILASGKQIVLKFPPEVSIRVESPGPLNTLTGGFLSTFTTWNPTNENRIKPVVSSPGGQILSTYLSSHGGYAVEDGTSMATPFTAGVVALYLQAKGKGISPKVINAALSATADPVKFNNGATTSSFLTSVAQQGGGLINAYKFIHSGITVSEASLAFNDTANHVANAAFYVSNTGKTTQTYTLTHVPAANVYAFAASDSSFPARFTAGTAWPLDTKYSTAVISPSTLTIKPGEKKRVTVAVTPDPSLDAKLVPFYSGYVNITGGGESIHIPYGGVATKLHDVTILAQDGPVPWPYFDNEYAVSVNGSISTFKPSVGSEPYFLWNNRWASPSIRLDIVSVDGPNNVIAAGLKTVGSANGYPWLWQPRGTYGQYYASHWDGTLSDGKKVPSGKYKFVLRFAKVFADLNRGREYETYESEVFILDQS